MATRFSTCLRLAGALLAALVLPTAGTAQYRLPELTSVAKADSLHSVAITMVNTTSRWRDAARLHRQSAGLRAIDDEQGFRCLRVAADLSYAAEDHSLARADLKRAADQALHRGDLEQAAHTFIDVAWVAQEQGKPAEVWAFGRQAEVLAASPLLGTAQRAAILKRITHTQGEMAVTLGR